MVQNTSFVDSKVYNRKYFLSNEYGGADAFRKGCIDKRFEDAFNATKPKMGMRILDIGCGKGEFVCLCASKGINAIGIDYSEDAINIANESKNSLHRNSRGTAEFYRIEGFKYPFESNSFDKVFLLDVFEHLTPRELLECLTEVKRLLVENGEIFVDTSPNRLFNNYAYPLWERPINRIANRIFGTNFMTRQARTECDKEVHINEQTLFSIKKYFLKTNFRNINISMHPRKIMPRSMPGMKKQLLEIVRCITTCLFPFSYILPLNLVFCNDIVVRAKK